MSPHLMILDIWLVFPKAEDIVVDGHVSFYFLDLSRPANVRHSVMDHGRHFYAAEVLVVRIIDLVDKVADDGWCRSRASHKQSRRGVKIQPLAQIVRGRAEHKVNIA